MRTLKPATSLNNDGTRQSAHTAAAVFHEMVNKLSMDKMDIDNKEPACTFPQMSGGGQRKANRYVGCE